MNANTTRIHTMATQALGRALREGNLKVTDRQYEKAQGLLFLLLDLLCHNNPDKAEFKELRLSLVGMGRHEDFEVIVEVGLKGDEDSLLSVLCRERRQFWVTPRGLVMTVTGTRLCKGRLAEDRITTYQSTWPSNKKK